MPRLLKLSLLFILASFSTAAIAAAPKSELIPSGPKAYTQAKFDLSRIPFCKRCIIGAYDKFGTRDSKWDRPAKRFLQSYVDRIVGKRTAKDDRDLVEQGKAAVDAGCSDPLVLDSYGTALDLTNEAAQAEPILNRAITNFRTSGYPKCRCVMAPAHLYGVLRELGTLTSEEQTQLRDLMVKQAAEAFHNRDFKPDEERIAMDILTRTVAGCFDNDGGLGELYSAVLGTQGLSPWEAKYVRGCYEIDLAWKARGTEFANKVTAAGWEGFEQHLTAANKLLHEAWKLNPSHPEAATAMIKVAMGGCAGKNETTRLWFKRAVAAQVDYLPAYDAYMWAIRPRWGGSIEEMHAFGVECLKTRRFDTQIPWLYLTSIGQITCELDGDKRYWKSPETQARVQALFDGYTKANNPKIGNADQCASMAAAFAALSERYTEAKKIIGSLGDRLDTRLFRLYFPNDCSDGVKYVQIWGGAWAEQLRRASKLLNSEAYSEALAIYKDIQGQADKDRYAGPYVRDCIESATMQKTFSEGKWVELNPRLDSENWGVHGDWKLAGQGAIQGTPDNQGLSLLCNVSFGDRYEIKGAIEFLSGKDEAQNAGLVLNSSNSARFMLFYRDGDMAAATNGAGSQSVIEHAGVQDKNNFLVQQWDDSITVHLNGKLLQNAFELRRILPIDHAPRVGIMGHMSKSSSLVKFSNLQIRRLSLQPDGSSPEQIPTART